MGDFYKDTTNLVECKISECTNRDNFLIGTWGNQGTYRMFCQDLMGNYEVKSIAGDREAKLAPIATVWRSKRLCEMLLTGNEKNIINPDATPAPAEQPRKKSNRLVDILESNENELCILNFL